MDTTLLKTTERTSYGRGRRFLDLGQLQPVLIGWENGRLTLRCEGMLPDGPCWRRIDMVADRQEAKAAVGELVRCRDEDRDTPARAWWRAYKDDKAA